MSTMEGSGDASSSSSSSKNYKTTLCQFYLQGPCKNGDSCSYAHGTSELRTVSGKAVADLESAVDGRKLKTKLCEKFLQYGACHFGDKCTYAHGVRELQKSAASLNPEANPAFKTTLCKAFVTVGYCAFGDKCQYAHGRHEIRSKPPLRPEDMDTDTKEKLLLKARAKADYKTKMCANFERSDSCEYGDLCHFAHGLDDLKKKTTNGDGSDDDDEDEEMEHSGSSNNNRHFKTIMCKNLDSGCPFGSSCQFAHSESELRQPPKTQQAARPVGNLFKTTMCKNFLDGTPCTFGAKCQFAHGHHELRSPGNNNQVRMPYEHPHQLHQQMMTGKYKTAMCQFIVSHKPCPKGFACSFAHSPLEMRSSSLSNGPGSPMAASSVEGNRYKTSMCHNMASEGHCTYGPTCNFAHSQAEMAQARRMDPTFKTALCESFSKTQWCDKGGMCSFAHGPGDLRQRQGTSVMAQPATFFGNGGGFGSSSYGPKSSGHHQQGFAYGGASHNSHNPKYKTVLCQSFVSKGLCDRGHGCTFAHGEDELTNADSYKTKMCKNISSAEGCPKADICHFAHSEDELRSVGGSAYSMKRKQHNAKTVLCQNYQTFGECQYGKSCTFAHGDKELQSNTKKSRIETMQ